MAQRNNLFKSFCLEGSLLGFKYLYLYPDPISRCFWVCSLVMLTGFAFMLSILLYQQFVNMPTRITIENEYESVRHLPFPSVSICTPNQITISAVRHFDRTFVDGNRSLYLDYAFRHMLGFYEITTIDHEALNDLQQLIDANRYTVLEVMRSLPQSCEHFLKLCFYRRRKYPNCKGLFRSVLTRHGMCCIFNSPYYFRKNWRNEQEGIYAYKEVVTAGLENGLTVITDPDPEDAVAGTLVNAGANRVTINDWTEFPADDQTYLVYPGTESFHVIHATYTYASELVTELPVVSRECLFESERHLQYFRHYRNSDCDMLCLAKVVEQVCSCMLPYLPNVRITMSCNVTSIGCVKDVRLQMNNSKTLEECDCPRDCNSRSYKVDTLMGNLNGLPHMIANIYGNIVFNKSTSLMHFYFPVPVYVKQKQETVMSITTLMSNIGGVFGLCIGCSFIGALEIGFYSYTAIRNFCKRHLDTYKTPSSIKVNSIGSIRMEANT